MGESLTTNSIFGGAKATQEADNGNQIIIFSILNRNDLLLASAGWSQDVSRYSLTFIK
jgi:hypothetical protein